MPRRNQAPKEKHKRRFDNLHKFNTAPRRSGSWAQQEWIIRCKAQSDWLERSSQIWYKGIDSEVRRGMMKRLGDVPIGETVCIRPGIWQYKQTGVKAWSPSA